jgi:hypothetical protein
MEQSQTVLRDLCRRRVRELLSSSECHTPEQLFQDRLSSLAHSVRREWAGVATAEPAGDEDDGGEVTSCRADSSTDGPLLFRGGARADTDTAATAPQSSPSAVSSPSGGIVTQQDGSWDQHPDDAALEDASDDEGEGTSTPAKDASPSLDPQTFSFTFVGSEHATGRLRSRHVGGVVAGRGDADNVLLVVDGEDQGGGFDSDEDGSWDSADDHGDPLAGSSFSCDDEQQRGKVVRQPPTSHRYVARRRFCVLAGAAGSLD